MERSWKVAAADSGERMTTATASRSDEPVTSEPLEVSVLGPLQVTAGGETLQLGGPKPRTVFALLVGAEGRAITADTLIDALWGEEPPPTARGTLQSHVSKLRMALGDAVRWEGGAYRLELPREAVDAWLFEDTVRTGRHLAASDPAAAAELLAEGLGMWRGHAYAGLTACAPVEAESRRLEELRLQAVEDRIGAELALGDHGGLAAQLETLTAENPLRERLFAQHMLVLYRTGQQAEALRVYTRLRETLADELGIDPSPELRRLHERILAQDPELQPHVRDAGVPDPGGAAVAPLGSRPGSVRGYELRGELGRGDHGVVHRAYQPSVGREVAVKIIRPEYANQPAFIRSFEAEAQLVAALEHPHIVALHDYWREPDGAYLVMPLMRGGSLADALQRGPWNAGSALRLLEQIGGALSHAHRNGILHRDVKPANVLLDSDGNAYLSDLGVAGRLVDAAEGFITSSLPYLPPEELRGEPLGTQADIFAFGVLIFALLTGVEPAGRELARITEARPDLPPELDEILLMATDDDPAQRYERVEDLLRALRRALGADVIAVAAPAPRPAAATPVRNPYKGLRAFQETDAADFYGRETVVDELLRAVSNHSLVAVVGASGSGKSSLVRAGLVPALRAGGLPGSRGWFVADMFPGSYPFEELESALLRVAVENPGGFVEELHSDDRGLLRVVKRILPHDDSELVLVIDQFEELFSLVDDESTRRSFLAALETLVGDERGRVRVVLTLRADFFDRPLDYPGFGELVKAGLVPITAPSEESLGLAVSRPARSVGLQLEPGLVGEVLADVRGQPGGLPLLQYALTELFQRRDGDQLTVAAYREAGGVAGALGRRAEELYEGLPSEARAVARQLFLRLVTIDEEADDMRRRVSQGELDGLDLDPAHVITVLQQYAAYRLLTFDRDASTRIPTVEVAHEALIREWPRLRGWIDEQRHVLVLHRRLQASLRDWSEAGEDRSFLLRGGRLEQAERWAEEAGIVLSHHEQEYLAASRQLADEEEETARRRRRRILGGLACALVVTAALGAVAAWQWRAATEEARVATERRLAGAAIASLEEDPERSILLALEAAELARDAGVTLLPETVAALHRSTQASRLHVRVPDGRSTVAASRDGTMFATDSADEVDAHEVVVRETATGEEVGRLTGEAPVVAIAFSPVEDVLAVAYGEGGEETSVIVWEVASGQRLVEMSAPPGALRASWSPDGRLLAVGNDPMGGVDVRTVTVLDAGTGVQLASFGAEGDYRFLDRDTVLVTAPELVRTHDATSGQVLGELAVPGVHGVSVRVEPNARHIVVSDVARRETQAWDLDTGSLVWSRPYGSGLVMDVQPSRGLVLLGGNDGVVSLWRLEDGADVMELRGHTGPVMDAAFTSDGERVISLGGDGETRVWDVTTAGPADLGALDLGTEVPAHMDLSPDGRQVAVSYDAGGYARFDLADGEIHGRLEGQTIRWLTPAPTSPDWRLHSWVDDESVGWVRDVEGDAIVAQLPACTAPKFFDPTGTALVLDGVSICDPAAPPDGVELRSRVIDPRSGDELLDLGPNDIFGRGGVFTPGGVLEAGRYVVVNSSAQALEVHDVDERELIATIPVADFALGLAIDPSGRYLAVGTQHGRAEVLDLAEIVRGTPPEQATVFERTAGSGGIPGVALSGDGVLATSAFDSLRLFNIHTGQVLAELPSRMGTPPFAAFAPDGEHLHYFDEGYVLRRLPLSEDRLMEAARGRLTRRLTVDECRRYLVAGDCS